jgi:hypothetical protein
LDIFGLQRTETVFLNRRVTVFYKAKRPTDMKNLPDLHKQAFKYKNRKRLQHDGGRAWIKDSQLFESRKGANGHLETVKEKQSEKPSE